MGGEQQGGGAVRASLFDSHLHPSVVEDREALLGHRSLVFDGEEGRAALLVFPLGLDPGA